MAGHSDDAGRISLLLTVLRLSRDAGLRALLEIALAALDDGRSAWAEPSDEAALLYWARKRIYETVEPEAHFNWMTRNLLERGNSKPLTKAERFGLAPSPFTLLDTTEAASAARELEVRAEAQETVRPGARTSDGWTLVARLELGSESMFLRDAAVLWALLGPDGSALAVIATGNCLPERWTWDRMKAELDRRQKEAATAAAIIRAVEMADPALQAERRANADAFIRDIGECCSAQTLVERYGTALLFLFDGQPVRAKGAVLVGADGEEIWTGIEARRLDTGGTGPFAVTPARPWAEQVWARPLGGGVWRGGRLLPQGDRLSFTDEPAATGLGVPSGADQVLHIGFQQHLQHHFGDDAQEVTIPSFRQQLRQWQSVLGHRVLGRSGVGASQLHPSRQV